VPAEVRREESPTRRTRRPRQIGGLQQLARGGDALGEEPVPGLCRPARRTGGHGARRYTGAAASHRRSAARRAVRRHCSSAASDPTIWGARWREYCSCPPPVRRHHHFRATCAHTGAWSARTRCRQGQCPPSTALVATSPWSHTARRGRPAPRNRAASSLARASAWSPAVHPAPGIGQRERAGADADHRAPRSCAPRNARITARGQSVIGSQPGMSTCPPVKRIQSSVTHVVPGAVPTRPGARADREGVSAGIPAARSRTPRPRRPVEGRLRWADQRQTRCMQENTLRRHS